MDQDTPKPSKKIRQQRRKVSQKKARQRRKNLRKKQQKKTFRIQQKITSTFSSIAKPLNGGRRKKVKNKKKYM